MTKLLEIRNLVKRYRDFSLEGANLVVEPGSVVGFVGSNGAGKTTTIKAALGLIGIDGGEVFLHGERMDARSARAGRLRERVGVVFDTCAFPLESRIKDVGFLGRFAYSGWDQVMFDQLLASFGLSPQKRVKDLSRGMGMKLTLAFALAHHPDLLILDEPTAGLDPLAREEALELLRDFMEDERHGILISTHITSDLEKIADRVVCIDAGRIVFDLPKDDICDIAGIARCRSDELEELESSGWLSRESARFLRQPYGCDVLVPNRFAFREEHPQMICERASLESYMTLTLKGEVL